MKGVQCYELFGGIALKNHSFLLLNLSMIFLELYLILIESDLILLYNITNVFHIHSHHYPSADKLQTSCFCYFSFILFRSLSSLEKNMQEQFKVKKHLE